MDKEKRVLNFKFGNFSSKVNIQRSFTLGRISSPLLFVFDKNTNSYFGKGRIPSVVLETGEKNKSWENVKKILEASLTNNLTRKSKIVGIGGGLLCDVTAFGASIYMRGCSLILFPTTLLAMVDAAIGGKTGINFGGFKNMVGTFYPAEEIHICLETLNSLPEKEYKQGLAEVIKTALLNDRKLFKILFDDYKKILERDLDLLLEVVTRCVKVKGKVVEEDFKEKGRRAVLNLGHTFAHALEAVSGLEGYSHGEAVAWGIARAMELGVKLGITSGTYAQEVKELLKMFGFLIQIKDLDINALMEAMLKDKKKLYMNLRFILQKELCHTVILEVEKEAVREVLTH